MLDTQTDQPADPGTDGASCAPSPALCGTQSSAPDGGLLGGGCCSGAVRATATSAPMTRAARRSRTVAGLVFLAVAGGMASRRLPGRIALWPASLVPTWFGISHLVAGVTGYQGCPELGAIPSVMLGRPIGTSCEPWRRIDRWV